MYIFHCAFRYKIKQSTRDKFIGIKTNNSINLLNYFLK